jgi:peptidoglycan/LPS O-acetylase OafA/YrhL
MNHIRGFDGLRAISVLLVIASHVGIMGILSAGPAHRFFAVFDADFGVRTFFVLSGFLITTLLLKERKETGGTHVPYFMARRALRILPVYAVAVGFVWILSLLGIAYFSDKAFLYSAFFAYNYVPQASAVNYLSHLWSLAIEEQFYLMWPFIFAVLIPSRRAIIAFCFLIVAVCWYVLGHPLRPDLSSTYYTGRWTIPAIYPIMIGCTVALLYDEVRRFTNVLFLIANVGLIALPLVATMTPTATVLHAFGIAGLLAWIVSNQNSMLVNALEFRPLAYIGTISYGLYIWQGILTGNGPYRDVPTWPPNVWIGALLTFIIAPISFHFFEKPILKFGKRFRTRVKIHPAMHLSKEPVPQQTGN